MRNSLLAYLFTLPSKKPRAPSLRRPLYIRREDDGKFFYRQSNGTYVNDEEGNEYLPMVRVSNILAGTLGGYHVSPQEASDFHAARPHPSASFLIGGHAP